MPATPPCSALPLSTTAPQPPVALTSDADERSRPDRLTPLLAHFSPKAAVYFHAHSCSDPAGDDAVCPQQTQSYLHLIEQGRGSILLDGVSTTISEPCILYLPRGDRHQFVSDAAAPLQMYCATIEAGQIAGNPLLSALPGLTQIPLSACSHLRELICLIWRENKAQWCGSEAAINRLTEYLLILLLRHIMTVSPPATGLLAALADKKLAPVFNALHQQPQLDWDLEQMAQEAAMSRARFAAHFRTVVGCTPGEYLTQWRLTLARKQLLAGESLKQIAPAVGYQSVAAFHRVFRQKTGLSPKEWLSAHQHSQADRTYHNRTNSGEHAAA